MVRFALHWWVPFSGGVATALAVAVLRADDVNWGDPQLAFAIVLALTMGCALGGVAVLTLGLRRRLPEVAMLGGVLWTLSVFGVVHALLIAGARYGQNPGTTVAALLSVPAALLAALPMLFDGTAAGGLLARRWRGWTAAWIICPAVVAAVLLVRPALIPAPAAGAPVTVAVVVVSLTGCTLLSLRHLRLFAIGRRAGSLAASLGFVAPGLATIAFLGAAPLSPGWWIAHGVDALGALFVAGGLLAAHWRDRSLALVLAPVLSREPLTALELGLTPVVHRFVAALEAKDAVTRDHVVRVGELAMRAAERAGLDGVSLRAVGLGGLLHDVGKLLVPDAVLTKPGSLTADERAVVERHTVDGEAMLAPYPHLAEVAFIVRSHHERPDGGGYPDGLTAGEIPLATSIVSVVDAWDAMTSDRPYRRGLPLDRAAAILREGAGSQWSPRAVDVVLAEVGERGPVVTPALGRVGRRSLTLGQPAAGDLVSGCLPDRGPARRAA